MQPLHLQKYKSDVERKRSVEKYADDYTIEYYTDEKGREKKRAVYIGPYVKIYEEEKILRNKLIGILAASLIVVAMVLWSHAGTHASAWWFGTVLPQVAALFPCLYVGFALPNLPFKEKELQRDKYMNGLIRLLNCFGAIAVIMTVEFIAEFVYRFIYKDWIFMSGDIIFLVKVIASVVFSIVAVIILRNIEVDETELGIERTNRNK